MRNPSCACPRAGPLRRDQADAAGGGVEQDRVAGLDPVGAPQQVLGREHGCDHVILYRDEDFAAKVKEITGGKGCQVVYDCVAIRPTPPAAAWNRIVSPGWTR
jgi:threonine dehydrogenase-like Zn-dependent dehydrogenase